MATPKTNRYEYKPLQRSNKEIRLLRLLPIAGKKEFKLIPACHIFQLSLDEQPKFVALSYVWGDPTNQRIILVESFPVRVTKNLYDAMMILRSSEDDLVIWIDSLCIDQSNNEEKSWQVGLMADIYRKASKVVAWLGLADSDDDSVMDYLNFLGGKAEALGLDTGFETHGQLWHELVVQPRVCRRPRPSFVTIELPTGEIYKIPRDDLHNLFYSICGWHDKDNLLPIAGIKRFFTRPWWGRIWILQEITLPGNVELFCGNKRISRRRCSAALNAYCALRQVFTIIRSDEPHCLNLYQHQIISDFFHHRSYIMLSYWNVYRWSAFPLVALLRVTCVGSINPDRHGPHHLDSTDPRDKIFALLGIIADREELQHLGVMPDYSKSCKEVYTTTMVALLQQGHMSLLSFCQTSELQPKRPDLPSWVPDWSRSATDMLQDVKDDHITVYPSFNASRAQSQRSRIIPVKKEGAVEGISVECQVYDEIYEVGTFPGRASTHVVPVEETSSWPVKWLVEILRLTYQARQLHRDFGDLLHEAARTSIGGVGKTQNTEWVRVDDSCFLDAIVLLGDGMRHIKEDSIKRQLQQLLKYPAVVLRISAFKSEAPLFSRLNSEIIGKSLGRLPFVTRKGHSGLTSEYVRKGDSVALIKGAQVPFILRRQIEGQYKLVSEAYVDGIMDGEAVEDSGWGDIQLV